MAGYNSTGINLGGGGFWNQIQAPALTDAQKRAKDKSYQDAIKSGKYQGATPIDPVTGQPLKPTFDSVATSNGLLKDQYQLGNGGYNTQGLEALRNEALRTGPSQWAVMQQAQQGNQLAQAQGGQLAQAQSRLAASGGLSGGARERLMNSSMTQGLLNRQNLNSSIANQDEQKRMATLSALPGQELQSAGFNRDTQQYNIDKALSEKLQNRAFDTNNYNEQMRAWASRETAKATPSGGGKK